MNLYFFWAEDQKPPLQAMLRVAAKFPEYSIYTPAVRIGNYYEAIIALDTEHAALIYRNSIDNLLPIELPEFVPWNDSEEVQEDEPIIFHIEDYALLY